MPDVSFDTYLAIAGVGLGVVAIAMAAPPLFQMMWGRPSLALSYASMTEQGARLLLVKVHNRPIRSAFLRRLGVKRDGMRIFADVNIREHGTGMILAGHFRKLLQDSVSHEVGLALEAAAPIPLLLVIAQHTRTRAQIQNDAPGDKAVVPLAAGEYVAEVRIGSHDGVIIGAQWSFVVGVTQDGTAWTAGEP